MKEEKTLNMTLEKSTPPAIHYSGRENVSIKRNQLF